MKTDKKANKQEAAKNPPPSNDTRIYPDMTRQQREKAMAATCVRVVTEDFSRKLSDDDLAAEDSAYTRNAMSVSDLKGKLKEITATYKTQIKALEQIMEAGLTVIATGTRKVNGKLFLYPDFQSNRMRYFDVYGDFIYSRPLTIDERQTKLSLGDGVNKFEPANDNETIDAEFTEVIPGDKKEGITIEVTDVSTTAAQPGNDKKAKRAAKKVKAAKVEGEVADLNEKVSKMTKRRQNIKSEHERMANQGGGDDHEEGKLVGVEGGGQIMEVHTEEVPAQPGQDPEFEQIPPEVTKIDPSQVPPLDDDLPE